MFKFKKYGDAIFNRFVTKNLWRYAVSNIVLNTLLPYLTLKNLPAIYLFKGQFCCARFLLPMAFFVPFVITFDILKRFVGLYNQGSTRFNIPATFTKKKLMFKMAGANASITFVIILGLMLALQLSMGNDYTYNGTILCLFLGTLAGIFSIVFTLLPLKTYLKQIEN